eukprot:2615103-Prymnesium_polylepis.1
MPRLRRRAVLATVVLRLGTAEAATFSTIATTGDAASGYSMYSGAAAVGTAVYFAPSYQHNVGVLDTA